MTKMNNYLLHLETSTTVCSVALSKNGQLLELKESYDTAYHHSEQLTIYIQDVVERYGISIQQLMAVSVSSGPGSYTGLRIGATTAKGLCYALDIPLIAVSSLENLALLAKKKYPKQTICALIDARRMEVFSAIYSADMNVLKQQSPDILDKETYTDYEPFIAVGNGAKKIEDLWKNRDVFVDSEIALSAKGQVELSYEKYINKVFENTAYFEPTYLKEWSNNK